MTSLSALKQALVAKAAAVVSSSARVQLSEADYYTAYKIFTGGFKRVRFDEFIIPQLSCLLDRLVDCDSDISVLEVGPGPQTPLAYLPENLRKRIKRYTALEPNSIFATELEDRTSNAPTASFPFHHLETEPEIHRAAFTLEGHGIGTIGDETEEQKGPFDVVIFCHSMYGMHPKRKFLEQALKMLPATSDSAAVVVFHRGEALDLGDLLCHRTASLPASQVQIPDNNDDLDSFASFMAGFRSNDPIVDEEIRAQWRGVCRRLAGRKPSSPDKLFFHSAETMLTFNRHATALKALTDQVPQLAGVRPLKNYEARACNPAAIVRPADVQQVRECVLWSLKHALGLTVIGGAHSGHCVQPNVVAIDMSAFDKICIHNASKVQDIAMQPDPVVYIGAGCKSGDVIRETMAVGLTLPLGDRPSVGIGLWLQGGIGHLSRLHGLTCDTIVGAVLVSAESGQIFCIGQVPSENWPVGAVRPHHELDLLWAMKGAGTNFGVVVGVTCNAFPAPIYSIENCVLSLESRPDARRRFYEFDTHMASMLSSNCSADAFLFFDDGRIKMGATVFEVSPAGANPPSPRARLEFPWGQGDGCRSSNGVELFEAGMYMTGMHGGHTGGKMSSFKRCLFLKRIGRPEIVDRLMSGIETRPSMFCYIHLLHGGGAFKNTALNDTAFDCRDWDFACVITAIWPRSQDGTELARSATQWVYSVAGDLLPVSSGAYGADLGPDPRDLPLAMRAFGSNLKSLARLKRSLDPKCVLPYACPLPRVVSPSVIFLLTGESCVGKDFCADIWATLMTTRQLAARVARISDVTKQEYAAATGSDYDRLVSDREYKEKHRSKLTSFFQEQVRCRPELPEEHFQHVVDSAGNVDVLFVTGMREEAPVAKLSHLVPESKLIEVNIRADMQTRIRRGYQECTDVLETKDPNSHLGEEKSHTGLLFRNDGDGEGAARRFAECHLLFLFDNRFQQLGEMVSVAPGFPSPGSLFRHILGIVQQPGGLEICTSLLENSLLKAWNTVDAIASCEAGGFIYASALALRFKKPLVLIREAGKLPPPTISTKKTPSYISTLTSERRGEQSIELQQDVVPKGGSVVFIDDVLSTGQTLRGALWLLRKAGIRPEDISVLVTAEFPIHRGRALIHQSGFARTSVTSLLVFGGT